MEGIQHTSNVFAGSLTSGVVGVVTGSAGARTECRRYSARVNAMLKDPDGGMPSVHGSTPVHYEVQVTEQRLNWARKWADKCVESAEGTAYNPAYLSKSRESVSTRLREGLPVEGNTFNFDSVLRRLGQALVYYTSGLCGNPDATWLLGGEDLNLLEVRQEGTAYGQHGVFVPLHAGDDRDIHVAAVLLYAARGCGANVYTTEVYAQNGVWAQRLPTGFDLVTAVYRAAHCLVGVSAQNGDGANAIGHLVSGMHDVASVVGQTDEGGISRDILRNMPKSRPYGMICTRDAYTLPVFPSPHIRIGGTPSDFISLVDSFLLASAAVIAVCDPGCGRNGDVPTTSWVDCRQAIGDTPAQPGLAGDWHDHEGALLRTSYSVGRSWVERLAAGVGIMVSDGDRFGAAFQSGCVMTFMSEGANRHLANAVVHPWFWIEPTPLIRHTDDRVKASRVCKIVAGSRSSPEKVPLFAPRVAEREGSGFMRACFRWHKPRDTGWHYLYSGNAHRLDGSGAMTVIHSQGTRVAADVTPLEESVTSPGVAVGEQAANTLAAFSWVLGTSGVPPPGMCAPVSVSYATVEYPVGYFDAFGRNDAQRTLGRMPARCTGEVWLTVSHVSPSEGGHQTGGGRSFVAHRGNVLANQLLGIEHAGVLGADATPEAMMAELQAATVLASPWDAQAPAPGRSVAASQALVEAPGAHFVAAQDAVTPGREQASARRLQPQRGAAVQAGAAGPDVQVGAAAAAQPVGAPAPTAAPLPRAAAPGAAALFPDPEVSNPGAQRTTLAGGAAAEAPRPPAGGDEGGRVN